MATVNDFFKREIPLKWQEKAWEMSNKRIKTEYMRDERLNEEERIKKIYFGYLGEFAFADYCRKHSINHTYLGKEVNNSPDNGDFKMAFEIIVDVKTQENKYFPREDWRCEVTEDQIRRLPQNALYAFCKLYNETEIIIVGWLPKEKFLKIAVFHEKGTLLKGKEVHYSKWDTTISQLLPIKEIKSFIENAG